jgi:hypothetical protein
MRTAAEKEDFARQKKTLRRSWTAEWRNQRKMVV